MLTFMLPSGLAALSTQAAVGPVARDSAQYVTPDIVLAQLDIIAAASGGRHARRHQRARSIPSCFACRSSCWRSSSATTWCGR